MPGSMSLLSMDLNLGKPSWMRSGLVIVAALRAMQRFDVAAKLLWKARVTRNKSMKRAAVRRIGAREMLCVITVERASTPETRSCKTDAQIVSQCRLSRKLSQ